MSASAELASIRRDVLDWYAVEQRDFPWRGVIDPYAVLVSEVMLQQTQASRVANRFVRFIDRFGDVEALATASTASLLAEWSGLGYNRRALALQAAASSVAHLGWPRDVAGLQRLPGVGPYTARAIASLAFGVPVGVVDTNVRRWLLRRFGCDDNPRSLQALADGLATPGVDDDVAAWTHASMELGAAVCRARAPRCGSCPIADGCPARDAAQRVPVPRQARLRGTARAYRGALVRALTVAPGHRLSERRARRHLERASGRIGPLLDDVAWGRIVAGLERDGLVHRSRGGLELGAVTIGT